MFTHTIESFGNFEKHTFANPQGDSFTVVPQYGACLLNLCFGGVSVLDGYTTPEELIANDWGKNIVLLPYPNRLRDGVYTHSDTTYQFELTNPATNNSIHGFGKDAPMKVKKIKLSENEASIRCTWIHDGSHKAYPFRFSFEIKMILRRDELEVEMKFKNKDTHIIPTGLGWHPYFIMSEQVDDTSLQMPECQLIEIDDRMLPTGVKTPYNDFKTMKRIGETSLDNGFLITEKGEMASVILQSERGTLHYWQELGATKWSYLQIFTPPHRKSIAIEPMTCNIDAFNNHEGLVLLTPKASLEGKFGIRFLKK